MIKDVKNFNANAVNEFITKGMINFREIMEEYIFLIISVKNSIKICVALINRKLKFFRNSH